MPFYKGQHRAGAYLRISREDGDKAESDSIHNQRELVAGYISRQDQLELVDEYVDDGYSGTTFDRPGFLRLMEDAKKKRIDCIVVKDLSRLGRNYIETGKYLEKIFPFLGIRFISVNDHYDSADDADEADQIIIPFKNLINDAYCRDISAKIRSQLDVKRKNGKFIGSFAGYGYLKDPEDKNHLVIDEPAAEIVRIIYGLKLDGFSPQRIAARLDGMNVPTPLEYKRQCGLNYNSGFRSGSSPKWAAMTINRILRNELYTGTMVQGKNRKINYKVKQSRPVEESKWIRVEETHEAIIPGPVFQNVQKLLKMDTRTSPNREKVSLFSGFLRCADCGQSMVRRSAEKKGRKYYYYHCSTYKNGEGCSSHIISEGKLRESVLLSVQGQIRALLDAEAIMDQIGAMPQERFGVRALNTQLASLKKEMERYKDLKAKLYQDMQDGIVSREEYREIGERFTRKLEAARAAYREAGQKKERLLVQETAVRPWLEDFKQYRNVSELDRKLLASLIDWIAVKDKGHIEIRFRYEDEMQEMLAWAMEAEEKINHKP